MVYQWKSGARIRGNPQKSGELFERLAASEEGLTAATLLEASKPVDAPLHDDFTWDDSEAAHEWRLHQSRNFINALVVVPVQQTEEKQEPQRAFFITTEAHKYEPITAIVQEQSKYDALLIQAFRELTAFRKKYESLKELQPVFEASIAVMSKESL